MADFVSDFWSLYVTVLALLSVIACGILLKVQSVRRVKVQPGAEPETTGHAWDDDLQEYNNPLPRWWAWMFYITIVFALIYLVLYPGLGRNQGTFSWSSSQQYQAEVQAMAAQTAPLYQQFRSKGVAQLAYDPQARLIGERLFLNYCAQCHGSDAGGSRGFPSLRDTDWLYGGEPEVIEASIKSGRNGAMPPFGAALGEDGVKNVTHYVMSLSGLTHDELRATQGKGLFKANCIACHGADGKGTAALGAPNLTDKVWLHGGSEAAIMATINKGRISQMPAHQEFLGEDKVHLLAAYVYGLSNPLKVAEK